jgi:hypothetical protein
MHELWRVEVSFYEKYIEIADGFISQAEAEYAVRLWKQKYNMTGEPFRYVSYQTTSIRRRITIPENPSS